MSAERRRTSRSLLANVLLLAVVAVWGSTFALVKRSLADCTPLLFNQLRMLLASAVLLAINFRGMHGMRRSSWRSGAVAGAFLALGYELQTAGLARTTASKSAFLTGTVVVLVPVLSAFPRLRPAYAPAPGWAALAAVLPAFVGVILLTTPAGTRLSDLLGAIGPGDALSLLCAVAFAGHLLWLARQAGTMPAGQLATLQVSVCAAAMTIATPLLEHPHLHWSGTLLWTLLFMALFATAAAFLIQTWAQQHLPPVNTALVLALEPVFAWLVSLLLLHERFSGRSLQGAALILGGLLVSELVSVKPMAEQPEANLQP